LLIAVDGTLINLTQLQLWFPVLLQTNDKYLIIECRTL